MPDLPRSIRRRVRGLRRRGTMPIGSFTAPRDLRALRPDEATAIESFHTVYYDAWDSGRAAGRHTIDLSWFGYRTLKSPLDLWTYQEILVETRPDLVIETGTRHGGSALYFAGMMDLLGRGDVLTIDIDAARGRPVHRRIRYLHGSSVDPAVVAEAERAAAGMRVMVVLDSDHRQPHVEAELAAYHRLVTLGCYLIVEDTNVYGHPVYREHGPGPMEALDAFMTGRDDFVIDRDRERFLLTLNPRGYLRRVR
jgi:cephalosporin hydroxylase